MDHDPFDPNHAEAELGESLALIDASHEDIAAGRVKPLDDALRHIAAELGLAFSGRDDSA